VKNVLGSRAKLRSVAVRGAGSACRAGFGRSRALCARARDRLGSGAWGNHHNYSSGLYDRTGTATISLSFDWTGKLTSSSCTITGDASSHLQCEQVGGAPITWRVHS
jgi:hypothetical protein